MVIGAMLEGIDSVAPIMSLVDAQVAATEARARLAVRGAQDHEARAARVEAELDAMLQREDARWAAIGDVLDRVPDGSDMGPDDLAALLGVDGPTANRAAFDALMLDPDAGLRLGPAPVTEAPPRDLASVARRTDVSPISRSDTDAFLTASVASTCLTNASGCGVCLRSTLGDAVLLGDGTCVTVQDGCPTRRDVSEVGYGIAEARELSTFRLATGAAPSLAPSARAALASCLHAREASVVCEPWSFGPYILFGAAIGESGEGVSNLAILANLARELCRAAGNSNAIAAVCMTAAYEILQVHIRAGDALGTDRMSQAQRAIDVGRVRWCRLSDMPVFWLPLWSGDPDVVGGADQPWTLDIPAAGATWHPQPPVMSLDPDWHARIVVVPGDANLWCVDPQGVWWSLDSDFEAILESRRAHVQPWLEALETMEKEVPARIERLRAAANAHERNAHGRSPGNREVKSTSTASVKEPERFSKEWVLERAKRYAYQDDGGARAAGARAARNGHYSRDDFLTVVRWKSARAVPRAERNAAVDIEEATRAGFHAGDELTRIAELVRLEGVGLPVASALLHFAFPDTYPILDFRALHTLGDTKRRTQYSPAFWADYLNRCQEMAERAGVSIRDLDKALWQDSREAGPGGREPA